MSGGSDLDKFDGIMPKEEIDKEIKELEKFKNNNEEFTIKKLEIDKSKCNDE